MPSRISPVRIKVMFTKEIQKGKRGISVQEKKNTVVVVAEDLMKMQLEELLLKRN